MMSRSCGSPQTLDHLEDNIRRVIADIQPQMLEKVIENWTSRLDYIRASRGSPMPEIIFKISNQILRENTLEVVKSFPPLFHQHLVRRPVARRLFREYPPAVKWGRLRSTASKSFERWRERAAHWSHECSEASIAGSLPKEVEGLHDQSVM
ncbi:hypothetical protein TNCV_563001 [Trichonephila clavipes]|nr:hypothetical protein TNCV_563001 [Trichonephila clavipes]